MSGLPWLRRFFSRRFHELPEEFYQGSFLVVGQAGDELLGTDRVKVSRVLHELLGKLVEAARKKSLEPGQPRHSIGV